MPVGRNVRAHAATRMKLASGSLAARLGKGLEPLYVLCGDEPLLADEALELIREAARRDGCGEREVHVAERSFDWDAFAGGLQNLSLFASRRLIELRLPSGKPGEAGGRFFTALAERPAAETVMVVVLPALDSKSSHSKWATALAKAAVWVELRPPPRGQLPQWLRGRLARLGLDAGDEALDLLAARVEGNLLAAKQEIDKLALLAGGGTITAEAVREAVADGARFDVFQLADAALSRDVARTVRVLHGLQREGEAGVLVLWSLGRDITSLAALVAGLQLGRSADAALADAEIWSSRAELFRRAARGRSAADGRRLLQRVALADRIVKGARPGDSWRALFEVALDLSSAQVMAAETA